MRLPPLLLAVVLWTLPALAAEGETSPPLGTGRLFLGVHLGTTLPFDGEGLVPALVPELGLQLGGPLVRTGPRFGLEWLATLDPRGNRWDSHYTYGTEANPYEVRSRGFNLRLVALPGARVLLPVRRRFLIHLDASFGPALSYTRQRYAEPGKSGLLRDAHWWPAYRVAAGAVMPYTERLRFSFTPFALQNYSSSAQRHAISVQLGLDYALN
jgi:hypothetical protein